MRVEAKQFVWGLLLLGQLVFAGNEAGNGGDVTICEKEAGARWELLDFYEAKLVPPLRRIDLGDAQLSLEQKIELALSRLAVLDPTRAELFRNKVIQFFSPETTRWVKGMELADIADSGYVPTDGCRVRQIAVQKRPLTKLHRLYTIDLALWELLDNNSRAGLVLHEVIYGEALRQGQRNSVATRKFTALLASTDLEHLSAEQYSEIVTRLFPPPKAVTFNSDGFEFLLPAGQPFSLDFRSLLSSRRRGPLKWGTVEALPKWAALDFNTGLCTGTPPANQALTKRFNLTVEDGIDGGVVPVTFIVTRDSSLPPVWVVSPLMFSELRPAEPFEISISPFVVTDQKLAPDFQLFTGPNWLRITNEGRLSGIPPANWTTDTWTLSVQIGSSQANVPLILKASKNRDLKGTTHETAK